jgi:N-acetylglucosamine-6-sulfatase
MHRKSTRLLSALAAVLTIATVLYVPPKIGLGQTNAKSAIADQNVPPRDPPAVSSTPRRPNIVFILTDDLSLNLLQFMPHVLKMEREGVSFSKYFVTDSLCCPSRSSIFTGEFPHNTHVFRNVEPDGGYGGFNAHGNEPLSFAVALQHGGYKTAMLGKYLNGYQPAKNGVAMGWSEWDVAGDGYREFRYSLNENGKLVHFGAEPADYLTDVLAGIAVKFIQRSADAPFFIEIGTFAPHAPYVPAPRDVHKFFGLHAPRNPAFNAKPTKDTIKWLKRYRSLSKSDIASINRDYRRRAQSVLAVDKMLGELEDAVARAGQQNNTYFVFSSDNGLHMGEYRLMPGKMTAFDTDIHVPLIVTGPGVARGRTLDDVVENTDLCPTFEEIAHVDSPDTIDGRSLVPLITGKQVSEWRTLALIEHHRVLRQVSKKGVRHGLAKLWSMIDPEARDPDEPAIRSGNPPSYEALRGPSSVYVEYEDGTREYHDIARDPFELHNTFPSLAPDEQATLHAELQELSGCHGTKSCWQAGRPSPILTQR